MAFLVKSNSACCGRWEEQLVLELMFVGLGSIGLVKSVPVALTAFTAFTAFTSVVVEFIFLWEESRDEAQVFVVLVEILEQVLVALVLPESVCCWYDLN